MRRRCRIQVRRVAGDIDDRWCETGAAMDWLDVASSTACDGPRFRKFSRCACDAAAVGRDGVTRAPVELRHSGGASVAGAECLAGEVL